MEPRARRDHILSTLQHGLWVLDVLGKEGKLTAKGLADRLELSLWVVYDLLATLEREGYVSHFLGGEYGLGGRITRLQGDLDVLLAPKDLVTRALIELRRHTGETVSANGWYGSDIVVQYFLPGSSHPPGQPLVGAGFREWSASRCTTKAILAFLSEKQLLRYLASHQHMPSRRWKRLGRIGIGQLRAELEQVAQQGYALDLEESVPGWCGVAAPLFDEHGFPVGSLGIASLSPLFQSQSEKFRREVVGVAESVSVELGHRGPYPPPSPLLAAPKGVSHKE